MSVPIIVVKVGGSVCDQRQLGETLRAWLDELPGHAIVVPGGGRFAAAIRDLDRLHRLGDEAAHWLAVRAMGLNAQVLAAILPHSQVVASLQACESAHRSGRTPILDPWSILQADESRPDRLPHSWDVTSDSIAARIALLTDAADLVLLKSCRIPQGASWQQLASAGVVDAWFPRIAGVLPSVRVIGFGVGAE